MSVTREFPKIPQITAAKKIVRKRVIFMGRTGSGKTTCYRCLTDAGGLPFFGLDQSTLEVRSDEYDLGFANVKFFDTVGLNGNYDHDKNRIKQAVDSMSEEEAVVDIIFICFPANRFTTVDNNILDVLSRRFSPKAKQCVRFIITHCAKWKLPEVLEQVNRKFAVFGDLTGRVSCVNLTDPRDADDEAEQEVILAKWSRSREELLTIIRDSTTSVNLKRILTDEVCCVA